MKTTTGIVLVGVVLAGILAVAGPTAAGAHVPFKLDLTITAARFIDPPPPPVIMELEAAGTGTHVGLCTSESTVTWVQREGGVWFSGPLVITAADGAKIFLDTFGWSTSEGADGDYVVEGGTGRFEGASGSGSFDVVVNDDGSQTATLNGTISH